MMSSDQFWKEKKSGLEIGLKRKEKHKMMAIKAVMLMIELEPCTSK